MMNPKGLIHHRNFREEPMILMVVGSAQGICWAKKGEKGQGVE